MNRITGRTGGKTATLTGAAVAMMSIGGAACAQSAAAGGGYEQPMARKSRVATAPRAAEGEHRYVSVTQSDDDGTYTLVIEGQDIAATINGENVPADRIQRDDGVVRLLDEKGKVVAEFQVSVAEGQGAWVGGRGGAHGGGLSGAWMQTVPGQLAVGGPLAGLAVDNPPPVMLGITMGEPSETLLEHLGLEAGSAILIDKVYEGLPADEGGMRDEDILIEFDGKKPLTEAKVRELLRTKNPGDEVKVRVVRKGSTKDLKIKLRAYDAEKLGGGAATGLGQLVEPQEVEGTWWAGPGDAEARKALEEALRSVEKAQGVNADEIREQVRKAIKEALNDLPKDGGPEAFRFSPRVYSGTPRGSVVVGPRPGQIYSVPPQPTAPAAPSADRSDLSRQMAELRAQLDEVQRSRDELREQLDEIKSMLKEMRNHDRP